jgi:xylulokinase
MPAHAGEVNPFETLAQLAATSPAGSNGLVLLPYFEGERTPIHDPKASGLWFGLSLKHTQGDLYRSILEGVAFGIRHNLEVIAQEGVQPKRLLAVGGGTKNPLWLQIVADVCSTELLVPEQQIGASYGDAFLAATGIGLYKELSEVKDWVRVKHTVSPQGDLTGAYEFNYQVFRDLYHSNKTLMHRLVDRKLGE